MPASDVQLADLGFQLIPPGESLSPYVRSYWYFRREIPLVAYQEEYMNPHGGFGIGFNFGDQVSLDSQIVADPVFLDGVTTVSRKMGFSGHVEQIGIQFYAGGAYPFFGLPLIELQNKVTLLDMVDRAPLLRLHARLQEAKTLQSRVNLLEEWLLGCLSLGKERDRLIPASLALLRESRGQLPISDLANDLFISQRQLERLYRNQVGMTPKQYARLVRIEAAKRAIKQINGISAANLAATFGFYDQAHFIREFRSVTGITPDFYLKLREK